MFTYTRLKGFSSANPTLKSLNLIGVATVIIIKASNYLCYRGLFKIAQARIFAATLKQWLSQTAVAISLNITSNQTAK